MAIRRFSTSTISGTKSFKTWDGETFPGYFESIATALGTGSSGEINFTNIPQNYAHLQIRGYSLVNVTNEDVLLRVGNSTIDSGSTYSWHEMRGAGGGAPSSTSQTNQAFIYAGSNTGSGTYPYVFIIDVLDYTNTNKNKTVRSLAGTERNSTDGTTSIFSGVWRNTAAIDTIRLYAASGQFSVSSHFALYGIRGA